MRTMGLIAALTLSFILGAHYGKQLGSKVDHAIRAFLEVHK